VRIRSIKPEFWSSSAISKLPIEDRLLFIGLWSYVDDNGVGIDKLSLIVADLFADDIERDARDTFARVSRGLASLSEAGRIIRYTVEGGDYLCIVNWSEHQRIDKPGKARYPNGSGENVTIRESVASLPEKVAPGAGEQGSRGTGEQGKGSTYVQDKPAPDYESEFADWWVMYPRKQAKAPALKTFKRIRKTVPLKTLMDGVQAYALLSIGLDKTMIKLPAGWLNDERWEDEQIVNATKRTTTDQPTECQLHPGYPMPCHRCGEEGRNF